MVHACMHGDHLREKNGAEWRGGIPEDADDDDVASCDDEGRALRRVGSDIRGKAASR